MVSGISRESVLRAVRRSRNCRASPPPPPQAASNRMQAATAKIVLIVMTLSSRCPARIMHRNGGRVYDREGINYPCYRRGRVRAARDGETVLQYLSTFGGHRAIDQKAFERVPGGFPDGRGLRSNSGEELLQEVDTGLQTLVPLSVPAMVGSMLRSISLISDTLPWSRSALSPVSVSNEFLAFSRSPSSQSLRSMTAAFPG